MWTNEGPSLYLAEDQATVVPEGDPRARYLLCAHGSQMPQEEAERYGLTGEKAKSAPDNKAKQTPPANKSKG